MSNLPDASLPAAAMPRRPWRLPLIAALALAFASLALISGIAYIAVLTGATGTAERLLVDRAERIVDAEVAMIRSRLDPVSDHLELIAALAASGRIDIDSPVAVREALAVMMTRVPAVSAAAFATLDLQLHRAVRHPDGQVTRDTVSLVNLPQGMERFRQLQTSHGTFWGALFWSEQLKQPVLNVRTPVRRIDDAFIGGLIATVAVGDLSYLIGDANQGTEGRYFSDLDRLTNGAMVGAATLAVSIVLAMLMGLSMARSIRTITSAAESIERLEFDLPFHKRSRLREIDDAGQSLDKARGALKWFGAYVPHRLVFRLMELGESAVASRRRDVTVMFTDIVGFTPQAEELPEQETADMLNHHFALLGACIDADQGVIDKYIGDCVMAVWGGLFRMEDHADHAVHAALEMARVIREDNVQRVAAGQTPVRLRVGVHSGPVVVGNIGAPGRVNYTVVGDTVNVAQRFEQLGKEFMREGEDVIVLVSGDTIAAMKHPEVLGELPKPELRHVKGREEPEQVYRLV
ncbi:MAG: hypothetical protein HYZ40_06225 [Rhodospirillales bacterium]|nr:hypothetical protein [Rhodospirillales bacterium]